MRLGYFVFGGTTAATTAITRTSRTFAFTRTFFRLGTADTFNTPTLCFYYIAQSPADYQYQNRYNNNIVHFQTPVKPIYFATAFLAFKEYSFSAFLFALAIRVAIIPANTKIATSPGTKPTPKEPVVMRVPI